MGKKLRYFLIGIIISFIINIIGILILFHFFVTPTYIQENNVIRSCDIFQQIQDIATNVSNHSYKFGYYDCSQFSRELVNQLNNSGISAYCVTGFYKKDNGFYAGHVWVEVIIDGKIYPIEATNGMVLSDDEIYEEYYKKEWKGFCV